jgi:integrase/recombinase XerD
MATTKDVMPPWPDAVAAFVAQMTEDEKSPQTIKAYRGDLALFEKWYQSEYQELPALDVLSANELRTWKAAMTGAGHAPQTVNRRQAAMQSMLLFAQGRNWCQAVKAPRKVREQTPPPRWLARREQLTLVRAVQRAHVTRDIALIALLLHTGLRISEAASLKWSALELSARKGSVTVIGKGRKQRTVPLNADARTALLELSGNPVTGQTRLGRDLPLFKGREGAYTANALWRIVTKYGAAAKLDDLTPHVLRHTFCRRLAEAGVRLEEIAALAGHESIETTRRYVEPGQDDLVKAVEKLAGGED